jgi:hypothetical protein
LFAMRPYDPIFLCGALSAALCDALSTALFTI